MQMLPHIIFASLTCSGASAVHPVVFDLLRPLGYTILPPNELPADFPVEGRPTIFVGHLPITYFMRFLGMSDVKVIFLYRDPRDVLVSASHADPQLYVGWTQQQILLHIGEHILPGLVMDACEWLKLNDDICFKLTFDELKSDMSGLITRLFRWMGIPCDPEACEMAVARHSFEAVTGRKRGEDGPMIRNDYMWRKGISGEWRRCFDAEVTALFKRHCGDSLIRMGFEPDDAWGPPLTCSFAVPPGSYIGERLSAALDLLSISSGSPPQAPAVSEPAARLVPVTLSEALQRPERPFILLVDPGAPAHAQRCAAGKVADDDGELARQLNWAYRHLVAAAIMEGEETPVSALLVDARALCVAPARELRRILRYIGERRVETEIMQAAALIQGDAGPPLTAVSGPIDVALHRLGQDAWASIAATSPTTTYTISTAISTQISIADASKVYTYLQGLVPPELGITLSRLQLQLAVGEMASVEAVVSDLLASYVDDPLAFALLLCWHSALHLARYGYPELQQYPGAEQRAFILLRNLHCYCLGEAAVQRAVLATLPAIIALPDALTRLGEAFFAIQAWDDARSTLMRALQLAPETALIHNDLAVLCWRQGQPQQAIAHLQDAIRLAPNDPEILANVRSVMAA